MERLTGGTVTNNELFSTVSLLQRTDTTNDFSFCKQNITATW